MTRARNLPNGLWLLVALAGAACQRADDGTAGDTLRVGDTTALALLECDSGRVVSEASRSDIVSWASGLTFQAVDSTRGYVAGVPSSRMRVEAAGDARRRSRAVLRRGCIIGRIVSTEPDTRLGLAAGTNYVWADSTSGGWRATVIPQRTSAALRSFAMSIHDHRASSPTESSPKESSPKAPALAAIAGPCVDCEIAGWCRWPTDTVRTR